MRLPIFLLSASALFAQGPPTSIEEYLGLTPAQTAEFVRNLDEYYARSVAMTERGNTVRDEIAAEILRVPIDPMAIGLRYAELETSRREFIQRGREIIAQHQSRLTPSQLSRLQTIIEVRKLTPVAQDAECLYLTESIYGYGGFCHSGRAGANTAATKAPARRTTDERSPLERFLQLTPDQITRYRANQKEYTNWQNQPTDYYTANDQACQAMSSNPLDPMQLGIPLARMATLTQEALRRGRELIAANQALLTNEQLIRLQILQEARDLSPTISLAESEGFLQPADGRTYFYFAEDGSYVPASYVFSRPDAFWLSCQP